MHATENPVSTRRNRLLDALPRATRKQLLRDSRVVVLAYEEEIFKAGRTVQRLLCPTTAVCSLIVDLRSGQSGEIGAVGSEGLVGIPALLGMPSTEMAVVQFPGGALEIDAERFRRLVEGEAQAYAAAMRYVAYAYHMAKQSCLCNAYHTVEKRIARWLLTMQDRAQSDTLPMTQELLGNMVSATRPRATEAIAHLRSAGVVEYRRRSVTVVDRTRLEAAACECYGATVYQSALPH